MDEKLYFENDDMLSIRSSKIKSFCSLGNFELNLSEIQKKKKNNKNKLITLNQNNNINKLIPNIVNLFPFINNIKKDNNISALKASLTISSNNIILEKSFTSNVYSKENDDPSKKINHILYSSSNNLKQKRYSKTKKNSKYISNKNNNIYNNIISNYKFRFNSKCQNNNEHSSDSSLNNIDINQKFDYYNDNYYNKTFDESNSSYIKFNTYIPKKKIEQNNIINQKIFNKSYYKTNEKNTDKIYIKKKIKYYDMNSNNRSNIDNSYLTKNSELKNRNKTPEIRINSHQKKRKNLDLNKSFDNKSKLNKRNNNMNNKKNKIDASFNSDRVIFNNIKYN